MATNQTEVTQFAIFRLGSAVNPFLVFHSLMASNLILFITYNLLELNTLLIAWFRNNKAAPKIFTQRLKSKKFNALSSSGRFFFIEIELIVIKCDQWSMKNDQQISAKWRRNQELIGETRITQKKNQMAKAGRNVIAFGHISNQPNFRFFSSFIL